MTNPYFDFAVYASRFAPGTKARAEDVNAAFDLVTTGFDAMLLKAPLASPTFTGTPTAPTAAVSATGTQLATLDFVLNYVGASDIGLPSPTGNSGKIIKTVDGISYSLQLHYPSLAGNLNKYLKAGASDWEWADPLPIGSIVASYTAPSGYLETDGSVYLQADYPDLFTAIGHPDGYSSSAFLISGLPAALPAAITGASMSSDGVWFAAAYGATSPYLSIYKRDGETWSTAARDSFSGTDAANVAFSPDGVYMAVAQTASPYLSLYKQVGDLWARLPNPATMPAAATVSVAWSADGTFLAIGINSAAANIVYSRSGDTFTATASPPGLSASGSYGVAWSPDGLYLSSVDSSTTPITWYRSGTGAASTFTKLATPGTLLGGAPQARARIAWSRSSNYLAISHATSPYLTIYLKSGSAAAATLAKVTDPATTPTGIGKGCVFATLTDVLFVTHDTAPRLSVYKLVSTTWTKQSDPANQPAGTATTIDIAAEDALLVAGTDSGGINPLFYRPFSYDSSTEFALPVITLSSNSLSDRASETLKTYIRAE